MATTELENVVEQPKSSLPVPEFGVQDVAIQALADEYMPLVIADVDDKEGFERVHDARMEVKRKRIAVEKKRKELKADALEYGRLVDGEAKRITAMLEPIETHLLSEETRINDEKDRIKREAEERRQAELKERVKALAEFGLVKTTYEVEHYSDQQFADLVAECKTNWEREQARLKAEADEKARREQAEAEAKAKREAAEAEARRKEQERLAKEREELERERAKQREEEAERKRIEDERLAKEKAELERQRKEQEAEQARLKAERERIEAEEAERQRQAELERAKKEAAERARREAEEKRLREEHEARERAEREEAERKRREALRPDRDKLLAVANFVEAIEVPAVSEASESLKRQIEQTIADAANAIRELVNEATG